LRKVQYYHSLLLDEPMSVEKQKNYLQRSAEAAGRMQGLIDDLLAFTRIAEPVESFEQVDMSAMIAEVWQFYRETVDRIQAELSSDVLPPIRGIAFQIRQLIVNLMGNSIKYRSLDRPLRIRITGGITGKFYKLSIADNGIGFETEQTERIFEIFQRLHRRDQYPGTGIGLAICRKVMENHKGHIEGRGIPGQGATFECYFPL
jgi:signal transduction histidine kinase